MTRQDGRMIGTECQNQNMDQSCHRQDVSEGMTVISKTATRNNAAHERVESSKRRTFIDVVLISTFIASMHRVRTLSTRLALGIGTLLLLAMANAPVFAQQSQTINFAALPNVANGVAPFAVSATASSGLPVSFVSTSPTVCTINGSTVTVIAGGTCFVVAQQPGNANYINAPDVEQSFIVLPGSQTINFAPLANQLTSTAPFTLSATASSGLPVSFTSGNKSVCTVSVWSPIDLPPNLVRNQFGVCD